MSGDLGPRVAVLATLNFVAMFADVDVLLVGDEQQLSVLLSEKKSAKKSSYDRISIIHAADVVAMDEDPIVALRNKKNSSMWQSINAVKNGIADACVSAGNTGALLAMGKYLLKTFPGLDRPAICKSIPTEGSPTFLLDLGANINCTASQLHQFALMGSVLAQTKNSIAPRIGLLNIGKEDAKGTDVIQSAQTLLRGDERLNYQGFVEPNTLFSGDVDVVVCDGFHGNIALKSSEGSARFIAKKIQNSFNKNWVTKMLALIFWPFIAKWQTELDPSMYNGASFLGLQKTVVKSHGNANKKAFLQALIVAREQVVENIPKKIQQQFFIS